MSRGNALTLATVTILAAACSSLSVNSDYDQSYDFSTLHNYAWAEIAGTTQQADQITLKRVMDSADQALAGKGFEKTDPGEASFLVAIQTGVQQETQYTTYGYGMGAWRTGGMATTTAQTYDQGTLILDVVDAQKKELVWRGSASGVLDPGASPDQKAANVSEAVTKMLADFPPTGGS